MSAYMSIEGGANSLTARDKHVYVTGSNEVDTCTPVIIRYHVRIVVYLDSPIGSLLRRDSIDGILLISRENRC